MRSCFFANIHDIHSLYDRSESHRLACIVISAEKVQRKSIYMWACAWSSRTPSCNWVRTSTSWSLVTREASLKYTKSYSITQLTDQRITAECERIVSTNDRHIWVASVAEFQMTITSYCPRILSESLSLQLAFDETRLRRGTDSPRIQRAKLARKKRILSKSFMVIVNWEQTFSGTCERRLGWWLSSKARKTTVGIVLLVLLVVLSKQDKISVGILAVYLG